MNVLTNICCICLKHEHNIRRLFNSCENLNYYSRLVVLFPEMNSTVLYNHGTLCLECCNKVDDFYKFRKQCFRNSQIFINHSLQLSSDSETSGGLCNEFTGLKEQSLETYGESGKSRNTHNLSMEGGSRSISPNKTWEGDTMGIYKEENDDYTGMNINAVKNYEESPNDNIDTDNIETAIYIKTENEVIDEHEEKTGIEHTAEWENENTDGATDHMYRSYTTSNIMITEEINIKSEPTDSRECQKDEMDNSSVANTEKGTSFINPDESLMSVAQNRILSRRIFKCGHCNKTFSYKRGLTRHARIHSGEKPFKCGHCNKAFRCSSDLIKHKRVHSGERPFRCDQCNKAFALHVNLITHKRIHSGEKPFICDQCNKAFTVSSHLNRHKRIHSGEKPYKCDQCDKTFAGSSDLNRHKLTHSEEKPFKCEQCDKAFLQLTVLNNHKRIHSGEKLYKCNQCDKAFSQSASLSIHKRIHSGYKPFKCEQCDKAFLNVVNLNNHKRIHSGEKPFKCDQCDKAFSQVANLIRHKRIHSGEKPFKCDECDKAFAQSAHLTGHKRTHYGEKSFKCDQCDKVFSYLANFTRHKRIHTG